MSKDLKSASKREFTVDVVDLENLQVSALMRIADATEVMAKNYLKLQNDLDYYRRRHQDQLKRIGKLERRLTAQRAVSTRYKNQLIQQAVLKTE